jgi:hypothetical protein
MNEKKCPFCRGIRCIKKGLQQGHQRWLCKDCGKKFQANQKAPLNMRELFCLYVFGKQTLQELSEEYGIRSKELQASFDQLVLKQKTHDPRPIALCVDTTFFGDFGVVVFRDQKRKENLWWKFVESERLEHYQEGRVVLESLGYTILSVTADGLPGLPAVFSHIPFLYCHFHARKSITKYLTRNPKTEAGVELQLMLRHLKAFREKDFQEAMTVWWYRHEAFLQEKTYHPEGGWSYTHRRVRSALRSLYRMSPYLFTYQRKPELQIPVTTNTLEGHFAHMKVRVRCHRGISTKRKVRLVETILLASSAQYHEKLSKELF